MSINSTQSRSPDVKVELLDVKETLILPSLSTEQADHGVRKSTDHGQLHPGVDQSPKRKVSWMNEEIDVQLEGWNRIKNPDEEAGLRGLKLDIKTKQCNPYKTGVFGETILHYSLLCGNDVISKWLMKHPIYGQTLKKAVQGRANKKSKCSTKFQGQGCLHIAIANRSKHMVVEILTYQGNRRENIEFFNSECPTDIGYPLNTQRATGSFFKGEKSNTVFMGETALDFAICTNQREMVDILMGYENYTDLQEDSIEYGERHYENCIFNGKWRASLKLKDLSYQNTAFHLCAIKGHTAMWYCLMGHLIDTFAAEAKMEKHDVEIKLAAEKWVRSQVNKFGFTPIQLAAYNNDTAMVKTILDQTRRKIYKWGEYALNAYTLNEIDDYYRDAENTPGVPITSIILSEGHSELLNLEVMRKLMVNKWNAFGRFYTKILCLIQLSYAIILTLFFYNVRPNLQDWSIPWGRKAVNSAFVYVLYFVVLVKATLEIVLMLIEMFRIFWQNMELQKRTLLQKTDSSFQYIQTLRNNNINENTVKENLPSIVNGGTTQERVNRMYAAESCCQKLKRYRLSWSWMRSLYFEQRLPKIPKYWFNNKIRKRHSSVAGFFLYISWLSNIGIMLAQICGIHDSETSARILLWVMVVILVIEYLMLFLWLQTFKLVGRFIAAMVTIIYKDVKGFLIVFMVILTAFVACFIIIMEHGGKNLWGKIIEIFWLIYELSVGTGEFFAEEIGDYWTDADVYLRTLVYVTYMLYLTLMLVLIMNLLIAVMSGTVDLLSSDMNARQMSLKLSSISLISRKLRALSFLTCNWFSSARIIAGQPGEDMKLEIREDAHKRIRTMQESLKSEFRLKLLESAANKQHELKDYYDSMYYQFNLEKEPFGEDGKQKKIKVEEKTKEEETLEIMQMIKKHILRDKLVTRGQSGAYKVKSEYFPNPLQFYTRKVSMGLGLV